MAVLQNMREKFGIAISVIIALSLLYFIAPMDDLMTLFGKPQNVGEIAGKGISYEDFQENVDKFTTINEIITGSSVQNEQAHQQIRNAAWQEMLDNFMFLKYAKAAGVKVGEAEKIDFISGENVSPVIAQNPFFADESGAFSVDNLRTFVGQISSDETGRLKTYWNYLQNTVYIQQYYAKYSSIFTESGVDNKLQIEREVADNNTTADLEFVVAQYPYAKDSTIKVSSAEIKEYYKAHKKDFKQENSRDAEYVVFEVVPSAEDIAEANDAFAKAYQEFGTTANIKTFLLKNSDRSLSSYWYKEGELNTINTEINDFVFGNKTGISPIVKSGNTFYAAKIMDTKMISDSVYVKHIMLQGTDAKAKADSLLNVVKKGGNFANLVAEYSADKGSAADGELGNIGWMTQTYIIPGFESVITAEINKPYTINTQYGSHVVVVTKKTKPVVKKQVAVLEKLTLPSKDTYNKFYAQANKFASIADGTVEGYNKAVDSLGVYSHKSYAVKESTSSYGSVNQAKEVTRWIYGAKAGKSSQIISVNNNYFFIVALNGIHKEGYKKIAEVSSVIEGILYNEKLEDKVKADVAAKIAGLSSMQEIAKALDSEVETRDGVALSSMGATSVEPAVTGVASKLEIGATSAPVKGSRGVYVVKVNNKTIGSFYTEEDAKSMSSRKVQYSSQSILPVMMEIAEVKDNRERYF